LNKLSPIDKLEQSDGISYLAATTVVTVKDFISLATEHIPRYKDRPELAKKEMKMLYPKLGKEWYQRARQAEALRVFAAMRDKHMEDSVAVTAARNWTETCF